MIDAPGRMLLVDGIRTEFYEKGSGPTVVLLHSGEHGGSAQLSWEHTFDLLAEQYHVLAPDLVGYGGTDKIRDFGRHGRRIVAHLTSFMRLRGVGAATLVGNSVTARFLCAEAARDVSPWPISKIVCISGGGFEPDNDARRVLLNYDGSYSGMRRMLQVLFHGEEWYDNDAYVRRRHEASRVPGAWEVAAAAQFTSPWAERPVLFGRRDTIAYENIRVPTLYVAGDSDPLLPDQYWVEPGERTPGSQVLVLPDSAHCPHIERAEEFNDALLAFLDVT